MPRPRTANPKPETERKRAERVKKTLIGSLERYSAHLKRLSAKRPYHAMMQGNDNPFDLIVYAAMEDLDLSSHENVLFSKWNETHEGAVLEFLFQPSESRFWLRVSLERIAIELVATRFTNPRKRLVATFTALGKPVEYRLIGPDSDILFDLRSMHKWAWTYEDVIVASILNKTPGVRRLFFHAGSKQAACPLCEHSGSCFWPTWAICFQATYSRHKDEIDLTRKPTSIWNAREILGDTAKKLNRYVDRKCSDEECDIC